MAMRAALLLLLASPTAASQVAVLGAKNFDEVVSEGFWLVEFYAPWCGHCKRLNPILDEISAGAKEAGMRIGKVDTTVNKKFADRFGVKGFPTLKFTTVAPTAPEDWVTYEGGRQGKDFLAFAERMTSPALPIVATAKEAVSTLTEDSPHGVAFLFGTAGDPRAAEHASGWAKVVAERVQHKVRCGLLKSKAVVEWPSSSLGGAAGGDGDAPEMFPLPNSKPFLAAIEEGERPRFFPGEPGPATVAAMEQWISAADAPLLSTFGASNFRKLGKRGKQLVVAVVDPRAAGTEAYLDNVKTVARRLAYGGAESSAEANGEGGGGGDAVASATGKKGKKKRPISEAFLFGSLDGVQWATFVQQFNVFPSALPHLVVFDMLQEQFYEDKEVDEIDEVDTFLRDVYAGKVPVQHSDRGMTGTMSRFWGRVKSMGWLALLLFVGAPLLLVAACILRPQVKDPDDDDDDEDEDEAEVDVDKVEDEAAAKATAAAAAAAASSSEKEGKKEK